MITAGLVTLSLTLSMGSLDPRALSSAKLAVLPFKNLNSEPALDFMKLGVAETMISDLKRADRDVVERDQVDKALAELALQGEKLSEDSRAARAGRLVGATHVIVGGVQQAGAQVRITARMVVVETGVVDATAKVTGSLDDIFGLQDALVGQLLKLPDPKRRPKPKAPKKTLAAYQAYAASLSTSSDAEKVENLRRALDLDPDFHYALYDLRALESRLQRYQAQGKEIIDERVKEMLAKLADEKLDANERNMQASQAMTSLLSQYRYAALLDIATRIEEMKLPPGQYFSAREYATYYVFLALQQLKRTDLALQAGERYLQKYPAGMFAQALQLQLRVMIEQGHRHVEAMKRGARDLEKIDFEERDYLREAKKRQDTVKEPARVSMRLRSFSFQRCTAAMQGELFAEALDHCKQFVEAYKDADDEDNLVKLARWTIARAYVELGRFEDADNEAKRLLDDHPSWAREISLETMRNTWPKP